MRLIGMLDSPYVRRVAISLHLLGVPFEHEALSVFSTFDAFRAINPVVKAPTLVCDDGTVLMESTLILDFVEHAAAPRRSLMPSDPSTRTRALRRLGLALASCDKAVQLVYERNLRPLDAQYEPWLSRVSAQLEAALALLEVDVASAELDLDPASIDQSTITAAVAWRFLRELAPANAPEASHPALVALSLRAESLDAFLAFPPTGPGVAKDGLTSR